MTRRVSHKNVVNDPRYTEGTEPAVLNRWTWREFIFALRYIREAVSLNYDLLCEEASACLYRGRDENKEFKGSLVDRFMWGVAIRYRNITFEHVDPKFKGPLTLFEKRMVCHAVLSQSKKRGRFGEPTPEYLAAMLNRSVKKIQKEWNKRAKKGIVK